MRCETPFHLTNKYKYIVLVGPCKWHLTDAVYITYLIDYSLKTIYMEILLQVAATILLIVVILFVFAMVVISIKDNKNNNDDNDFMMQC